MRHQPGNPRRRTRNTTLARLAGFCRIFWPRQDILDRTEVSRTAAELGMSNAQFMELRARGERRDVADRLVKLRARLQIGAGHWQRAGGLARDMERVCTLCDAVPRCRAWLKRGERAGQPADAPVFCPNRENFRTLRSL